MGTDSKPTVGVAMAAYNGGEWIAETLCSVLEQTDPPDEVFVVDDGSEDNTAEVVERFGDRVTLIRQDNRGSAAAYDRAIRAGSAEYVAVCPQDDLWEPKKLEWQREMLRHHPETDVAFGHLRYFGARSGDYVRPPGCGPLETREMLTAMYRVNVVAAPTAVIRRALYERVGGFRWGIFIEDYEFWMRALVANARFCYDPRVLAHHRWHGGNLSSESLALTELDYEIRKTFASYVDDHLARPLLARDQLVIARYLLLSGRPREARSAYLESFRWQPRLRTAVAALALSIPLGRRAGVRRARRSR
jgi:glycosyltransferase involved in cell wall biosynthesis